MHTKPVHIHLKPDAVPQAQHVPIPVPYHWKDRVKQDLDADVARHNLPSASWRACKMVQ